MSTIPRPTGPEDLERVLAASADAFEPFAALSRIERANVLDAIAAALDAAAGELIPVAMRETNLPEDRLRPELKRTTFQLRFFGEVLRDGAYQGLRIDHADADWPMGAPRPDLRRMLVPMGPVLVFSASNFAFAFSVAGGDTASALAAGCPVVVKAHSGHPELSALTAQYVREALASVSAPEGAFGMIYGTEAGRVAIQDPRISACGFTGSIAGGRALFDLANARPDPIPFYGELGSSNPVFVTAAADAERAEEIAAGYIASFTTGYGQLCTKPGTLLLPRGSRTLGLLRETPLPEGGRLLNERIRQSYVEAVQQLDAADAQLLNAGPNPYGEAPSPTIHVSDAAAVLANPVVLLEERFGPSGLVVEYDDASQLVQIARVLEGQLTSSIHATDECEVRQLLDALVRIAGRVLWNQWPTGLSVTHAQQHGGPYPSSTDVRSTSVGGAAIERFLRPVSFQGFPQHLLPDALRDSPSAEERSVARLIDGTHRAVNRPEDTA